MAENLNTTHREPPGPAVGFDINVTEDSFPRVKGLAEEFVDLARVFPPGRKAPSFLVNHPDYVQRVLAKNYKNYVKGRGFERVKMLLGHGLIVSDGEFWRGQRRMIQPAFHRDVVAQLSEMIRQVNQRLLEKWQAQCDQGESINVTSDVADLSLEIVVRSLFGDDYKLLVESLGGIPFSFLTEDRARDLQTVVRLRAATRLIQEVIDQRRGGGEHFDIVAFLMAARHPDTGEPMTDKVLIDEITTMVVAGHETTATTLNWCWYLISQDAHVEELLHHEVDALTIDGAPSFSDLPQLGYAGQILEETLRLYPPVWLFSRRSLAEDRLGEYLIPAGADLFLSPYFLHRHPGFWPDAEEFRPERFTETEKKTRHRFVYIPFSAGPRRCIGDVFSMVEMQIHLGLVARALRLQYVESKQPEIQPGMNLRSRHPLIFQAEAR